MRLELRIGAEQFGAARAAGVDTLGLRVGVLAGERPLGARLAQDLVLGGCELGAPLVVGLHDLRCGLGGGIHATKTMPGRATTG
jgi:hypothetical protein